MHGWRIGLIVPSSNTTMESELNRMAPEGVSIHTARVSLGEMTPEAMEKMENKINENKINENKINENKINENKINENKINENKK